MNCMRVLAFWARWVIAWWKGQTQVQHGPERSDGMINLCEGVAWYQLGSKYA